MSVNKDTSDTEYKLTCSPASVVNEELEETPRTAENEEFEANICILRSVQRQRARAAAVGTLRDIRQREIIYSPVPASQMTSHTRHSDGDI